MLQQPSHSIPVIQPCFFLRREGGLRPRQKSGCKFAECWHPLLVAEANLASSQRCAMRSFHLAGNFVVSLFGRLTDELASPLKFVPINFAAAFVNCHDYLPPSFPRLLRHHLSFDARLA